MCGQRDLAGILNAHYGGPPLLAYGDSAGEMWFRVPAPLRDPQLAAFRSGGKLLNELAVNHRLSLLVGRGRCGVPADSVLAIKSVATSLHGIDVVDTCEVRFRCEVTDTRRGVTAAFRTIFISKSGAEMRVSDTSFAVLPRPLATFVRRSRRFEHFAETALDRRQPCLAVIDGHLRYYPCEADRLSDGVRVDHVPALVLVDIALSLDTRWDASSAFAAEFLSYADPRRAFDVFPRDGLRGFEFVQDNELVAVLGEPSGNQQSRRGIA